MKLTNFGNDKRSLCEFELNTEEGFHGSVFFFLAKNEFTLMEEDTIAARIEADLMKLINDDLEKETPPESQFYRAIVELFEPAVNLPPGFASQPLGTEDSGYQDENLETVAKVEPPPGFSEPTIPYESLYALFHPTDGLNEEVYPSFKLPPYNVPPPSFASVCLPPPHLHFGRPKQGRRF